MHPLSSFRGPPPPILLNSRLVGTVQVNRHIVYIWPSCLNFLTCSIVSHRRYFRTRYSRTMMLHYLFIFAVTAPLAELLSNQNRLQTLRFKSFDGTECSISFTLSPDAHTETLAATPKRNLARTDLDSPRTAAPGAAAASIPTATAVPTVIPAAVPPLPPTLSTSRFPSAGAGTPSVPGAPRPHQDTPRGRARPPIAEPASATAAATVSIPAVATYQSPATSNSTAGASTPSRFRLRERSQARLRSLSNRGSTLELDQPGVDQERSPVDRESFTSNEVNANQASTPMEATGIVNVTGGITITPRSRFTRKPITSSPTAKSEDFAQDVNMVAPAPATEAVPKPTAVASNNAAAIATVADVSPLKTQSTPATQVRREVTIEAVSASRPQFGPSMPSVSSITSLRSLQTPTDKDDSDLSVDSDDGAMSEWSIDLELADGKNALENLMFFESILKNKSAEHTSAASKAQAPSSSSHQRSFSATPLSTVSNSTAASTLTASSAAAATGATSALPNASTIRPKRSLSPTLPMPRRRRARTVHPGVLCSLARPFHTPENLPLLTNADKRGPSAVASLMQDAGVIDAETKAVLDAPLPTRLVDYFAIYTAEPCTSSGSLSCTSAPAPSSSSTGESTLASATLRSHPTRSHPKNAISSHLSIESLVQNQTLFPLPDPSRARTPLPQSPYYSPSHLVLDANAEFPVSALLTSAEICATLAEMGHFLPLPNPGYTPSGTASTSAGAVAPGTSPAQSGILSFHHPLNTCLTDPLSRSAEEEADQALARLARFPTSSTLISGAPAAPVVQKGTPSLLLHPAPLPPVPHVPKLAHCFPKTPHQDLPLPPQLQQYVYPNGILPQFHASRPPNTSAFFAIPPSIGTPSNTGANAPTSPGGMSSMAIPATPTLYGITLTVYRKDLSYSSVPASKIASSSSSTAATAALDTSYDLYWPVTLLFVTRYPYFSQFRAVLQRFYEVFDGGISLGEPPELLPPAFCSISQYLRYLVSEAPAPLPGGTLATALFLPAAAPSLLLPPLQAPGFPTRAITPQSSASEPGLVVVHTPPKDALPVLSLDCRKLLFLFRKNPEHLFRALLALLHGMSVIFIGPSAASTFEVTQLCLDLLSPFQPTQAVHNPLPVTSASQILRAPGNIVASMLTTYAGGILTALPNTVKSSLVVVDLVNGTCDVGVYLFLMRRQIQYLQNFEQAHAQYQKMHVDSRSATLHPPAFVLDRSLLKCFEQMNAEYNNWIFHSHTPSVYANDSATVSVATDSQSLTRQVPSSEPLRRSSLVDGSDSAKSRMHSSASGTPHMRTLDSYLPQSTFSKIERHSYYRHFRSGTPQYTYSTAGTLGTTQMAVHSVYNSQNSAQSSIKLETPQPIPFYFPLPSSFLPPLSEQSKILQTETLLWAPGVVFHEIVSELTSFYHNWLSFSTSRYSSVAANSRESTSVEGIVDAVSFGSSLPKEAAECNARLQGLCVRFYLSVFCGFARSHKILTLSDVATSDMPTLYPTKKMAADSLGKNPVSEVHESYRLSLASKEQVPPNTLRVTHTRVISVDPIKWLASRAPPPATAPSEHSSDPMVADPLTAHFYYSLAESPVVRRYLENLYARDPLSVRFHRTLQHIEHPRYRKRCYSQYKTRKPSGIVRAHFAVAALFGPGEAPHWAQEAPAAPGTFFAPHTLDPASFARLFHYVPMSKLLSFPTFSSSYPTHVFIAPPPGVYTLPSSRTNNSPGGDASKQRSSASPATSGTDADASIDQDSIALYEAWQSAVVFPTPLSTSPSSTAQAAAPCFSVRSKATLPRPEVSRARNMKKKTSKERVWTARTLFSCLSLSYETAIRLLSLLCDANTTTSVFSPAPDAATRCLLSLLHKASDSTPNNIPFRTLFVYHTPTMPGKKSRYPSLPLPAALAQPLTTSSSGEWRTISTPSASDVILQTLTLQSIPWIDPSVARVFISSLVQTFLTESSENPKPPYFYLPYAFGAAFATTTRPADMFTGLILPPFVPGYAAHIFRTMYTINNTTRPILASLEATPELLPSLLIHLATNTAFPIPPQTKRESPWILDIPFSQLPAFRVRSRGENEWMDGRAGLQFANAARALWWKLLLSPLPLSGKLYHVLDAQGKQLLMQATQTPVLLALLLATLLDIIDTSPPTRLASDLDIELSCSTRALLNWCSARGDWYRILQGFRFQDTFHASEESPSSNDPSKPSATANVAFDGVQWALNTPSFSLYNMSRMTLSAKKVDVQQDFAGDSPSEQQGLAATTPSVSTVATREYTIEKSIGTMLSSAIPSVELYEDLGQMRSTVTVPTLLLQTGSLFNAALSQNSTDSSSTTALVYRNAHLPSALFTHLSPKVGVLTSLPAPPLFQFLSESPERVSLLLSLFELLLDAACQHASYKSPTMHVISPSESGPSSASSIKDADILVLTLLALMHQLPLGPQINVDDGSEAKAAAEAATVAATVDSTAASTPTKSKRSLLSFFQRSTRNVAATTEAQAPTTPSKRSSVSGEMDNAPINVGPASSGGSLGSPTGFHAASVSGFAFPLDATAASSSPHKHVHLPPYARFALASLPPSIQLRIVLLWIHAGLSVDLHQYKVLTNDYLRTGAPTLPPLPLASALVRQWITLFPLLLREQVCIQTIRSCMQRSVLSLSQYWFHGDSDPSFNSKWIWNYDLDYASQLSNTQLYMLDELLILLWFLFQHNYTRYHSIHNLIPAQDISALAPPLTPLSDEQDSTRVQKHDDTKAASSQIPNTTAVDQKQISQGPSATRRESKTEQQSSLPATQASTSLASPEASPKASSEETLARNAGAASTASLPSEDMAPVVPRPSAKALAKEIARKAKEMRQREANFQRELRKRAEISPQEIMIISRKRIHALQQAVSESMNAEGSNLMPVFFQPLLTHPEYTKSPPFPVDPRLLPLVPYPSPAPLPPAFHTYPRAEMEYYAQQAYTLRFQPPTPWFLTAEGQSQWRLEQKARRKEVDRAAAKLRKELRKREKEEMRRRLEREHRRLQRELRGMQRAARKKLEQERLESLRKKLEGPTSLQERCSVESTYLQSAHRSESETDTETETETETESDIETVSNSGTDSDASIDESEDLAAGADDSHPYAEKMGSAFHEYDYSSDDSDNSAYVGRRHHMPYNGALPNRGQLIGNYAAADNDSLTISRFLTTLPPLLRPFFQAHLQDTSNVPFTHFLHLKDKTLDADADALDETVVKGTEKEKERAKRELKKRRDIEKYHASLQSVKWCVPTKILLSSTSPGFAYTQHRVQIRLSDANVHALWQSAKAQLAQLAQFLHQAYKSLQVSYVNEGEDAEMLPVTALPVTYATFLQLEAQLATYFSQFSLFHPPQYPTTLPKALSTLFRYQFTLSVPSSALFSHEEPAPATFSLLQPPVYLDFPTNFSNLPELQAIAHAQTFPAVSHSPSDVAPVTTASSRNEVATFHESNASNANLSNVLHSLGSRSPRSSVRAPLFRTFTGHTPKSAVAAMSHDRYDNRIVTGGADGRILLWTSFVNGTPCVYASNSPLPAPPHVQKTVPIPNKETLANQTQLWHLPYQSGTLLSSPQATHTSPVTSVKVQGDLIASGTLNTGWALYWAPRHACYLLVSPNNGQSAEAEARMEGKMDAAGLDRSQRRSIERDMEESMRVELERIDSAASASSPALSTDSADGRGESSGKRKAQFLRFFKGSQTSEASLPAPPPPALLPRSSSPVSRSRRKQNHIKTLPLTRLYSSQTAESEAVTGIDLWESVNGKNYPMFRKALPLAAMFQGSPIDGPSAPVLANLDGTDLDTELGKLQTESRAWYKQLLRTKNKSKSSKDTRDSAPYTLEDLVTILSYEEESDFSTRDSKYTLSVGHSTGRVSVYSVFCSVASKTAQLEVTQLFQTPALKDNAGAVSAVSISPDGKYVASSHRNGSLVYADITKGAIANTLVPEANHTAYYNEIPWSYTLPHSYLHTAYARAYSGTSQREKLYPYTHVRSMARASQKAAKGDIQRAYLLRTADPLLQPSSMPLTGLHWTTSGDSSNPFLISTSLDGRARLWDMRQHSVAKAYASPSPIYSSVFLSKAAVTNSSSFTAAHPQAPHSDNAAVHPFLQSAFDSFSPFFNPVRFAGAPGVGVRTPENTPYDTSFFLTGHSDGVIRLWDHRYPSTPVTMFHTDNSSYYSSANAYSLASQGVQTASTVSAGGRSSRTGGTIVSIDCHGSIVAAGSSDGNISLINVATGATLTFPLRPTIQSTSITPRTGVSFNTDGSQLISTDWDGNLHVMEMGA